MNPKRVRRRPDAAERPGASAIELFSGRQSDDYIVEGYRQPVLSRCGVATVLANFAMRASMSSQNPDPADDRDLT
jgi:hypothetical protein